MNQKLTLKLFKIPTLTLLASRCSVPHQNAYFSLLHRVAHLCISPLYLQLPPGYIQGSWCPWPGIFLEHFTPAGGKHSTYFCAPSCSQLLPSALSSRDLHSFTYGTPLNGPKSDNQRMVLQNHCYLFSLSLFLSHSDIAKIRAEIAINSFLTLMN